ncbi:transcription factor GTE4-like isoform X2 [Tripterygium wilfordii]|uniref:transcription factor GTE4-like isoform X2 n=1 Tax=Tripterygium wilfordii TaxID=458696 RepID=UPI0018F823B7|nr:transcription factor GTE4-like isoform X2 [Tripterygium wilfordii]
MASGTIVGEGTEVNKEKQRYTESKVYTRKAFKGPKKNNTAVPTTTTDTNADNNTSFAANTANDNEDNNNISSKDGGVDNDNNNINSKDGGVDNDGKKKNDSIQDLPQVVPTKEVDSSLQQVVSRLDVALDDTSSLNRQQEVEPVVCEQLSGNGAMKEGSDDRWKVNVPSLSKNEVRELRMKLEGELDVVRSLAKKVEEKKGPIGGGVSVSGGSGGGVVSHSRVPLNFGFNHAVKRVHSEVASAGVPVEGVTPRQSRSLNQLSIPTSENSQGAVEHVEKEKRTPKANQFYRNSEFLLAKDKFPTAESNKRAKLNGKKQGGGEVGHGFRPGSKVFKSCSALLERLMKHKHGWVFNTPVDVNSLGLHDYFTIIKYPMDLGTVKSKLNKNWYKSPREFAEDVRLTFSNAMTYNPKGQDVHIMAEQLSKIFEEKWAVIESDYIREMRLLSVDYAMGIHTPTSRKAPPFRPPPLDMRRILNRSESMTYPPPLPSVRTPALKKPKAKDPHKRDMTYEEKQKLSTNLQSLPSEKLDNIVQIIKKRNSTLFQHDDEIEVDIDSVDAETLWELDRFVTNYKKSLSKHKRRAELAMQARAEAELNVQQQLPAPAVAEAPKEMEIDGRNGSSSLPVQGGKGGDDASRSSSSSSSSSDSGSSSSDSDSDSSSASESDVGHSPRT